jgi:ATP-dependent DNA helicase RecQ
MFRLAEQPGCRHQALVAYFDEAIPPCGAVCDRCRGETLADLVAAPAPGSVAPRAPGRTAPTSRAAAPVSPAMAAPIPTLEADPVLFQRLRTLRRRLADAEGVPAYVIFSDAALTHMAAARPTDQAGLLAIPGVGPVKLARYGAAFLAALRGG